MDSASLQFIVFGLAVALASNISRARSWRYAVLMLASVALLMIVAGRPANLIPLLGFLALSYAGLVGVRRGLRGSLPIALLGTIVIYAWLKKYSFLPDSVFLHVSYLTLGLSYIFFRVLSLLIDSADDPERPKIGIGAYLLYTLNFTTLVSGPIQRYEDFARDQFAAEPPELGAHVIGEQLERIVRGFFKVSVLALFFDTVHVDALAQLAQPLTPAARIWPAMQLAVAYPLFLYCDFSGYIDIVISIARLMRLRLPENFNRPFSASSFLDFWNRWHITLSSWLKTYVYNPLLLALMRRLPAAGIAQYLGVFSFFVTFFIVGIWHGRTSEFVMFGILQGGGVATNKLWQIQLGKTLGRKRYLATAARPIYISLGRGLTFTWFAFTLFWFWATWTQIGMVYAALNAAQWIAVWVSIWLGAAALLEAWERLRKRLISAQAGGRPLFTGRYARVTYATAMALFAFIVTCLLNQPAPGIIYKAF